MTDEHAAAGQANADNTDDEARNGDSSQAGSAESAGPGPAGGATEESIDELRARADENWGQYLRAVAELDNMRKRHARDLENARKYGGERLLTAILPVRDSLEAGLKAIQDADPATVDVGALLEGDRATLRLLDQALEAAGITEINPEGEPFDPSHHEAMSMMPSDTVEPNSVIAVIQKGYQLHDRTVRPARVVVAQAPQKTE